MKNQSINCLIIDDNANSRKLIKSMLKDYPENLNLSHEASSCAEAIIICNKILPDIVFLDVDLGEGEDNGFKFLDKVQYKNFRLIFISAFESFAIKAFKANAVDYILKPFEKEELYTAVNKSLSKPFFFEAKESLKILSDYVNGETNRIALPVQRGFDFFDLRDIIRCEAQGNYTRFYIKGLNPILVTKTLGFYEDILCSRGFARIHASHIVNVREVQSYEKGSGGAVILKDGLVLEVSKSKKKAFLIKLLGLSINNQY